MDKASGADFCLESLKQADPERFFTCLFAPSEFRSALAALYAFNLDIVRTREIVSEPMIGEIRLQWWRDALSGKGEGDVASHPIAGPLLDAISKYHLPSHALINLIDARVFDLYDDPMPSLNDLEAYCGETSSALFQLSLFILSNGKAVSAADLCGHAGVAFGMMSILKALPWHSARGQVYVPRDILERHHITADDIRRRELTPAISAALSEMRTLVRQHLDQVRHHVKALSPELVPAFLSLTSIEPVLRAMDKPNYDPFKSVIEPSRLALIYRYWRASRTKLI